MAARARGTTIGSGISELWELPEVFEILAFLIMGEGEEEAEAEAEEKESLPCLLLSGEDAEAGGEGAWEEAWRE